MPILEAISKVLPVILLFALGAIFRRSGFLRAQTIEDIKQLVVNVTLPAVLFLAFSAVRLELQHIAIAGIVFVACTVVLALGRWLHPLAGTESRYLPPLLTGFEAGMMGYAIFAAVYGTANVFNFAVADLGQVVFVFFVLVPFVQRQGAGAVPFAQTLRDFLRTPVILGIVLGIVCNRIGIMPAIGAWPPTAAILRTLELLAAVTTPLIGIAIGYELQWQQHKLAIPLRTTGVRLLIWVTAGLLLNALVVSRLFAGNTLMQAAVLTLFVLPPPFVIPLFMHNASAEDQAYVVNTLALATLATLVAFSMISIAYPA
jgi:predicted permease